MTDLGSIPKHHKSWKLIDNVATETSFQSHTINKDYTTTTIIQKKHKCKVEKKTGMCDKYVQREVTGALVKILDSWPAC